jgi:hypothetical protein
LLPLVWFPHDWRLPVLVIFVIVLILVFVVIIGIARRRSDDGEGGQSDPRGQRDGW